MKKLLLFLLLPVVAFGQGSLNVAIKESTGAIIPPYFVKSSTNAVGYPITNLLHSGTLFVSTYADPTVFAGVVGDATKPFTLSNAVKMVDNNQTILIQQGRYALGGVPGQRTNAPLVIAAKTNVFIVGIGNPIINLTDHGTMWHVRNCSNVVFHGLTMTGVMTNAILVEQNAAVWESGRNKGVKYYHNRFEKWPNHGLCVAFEDGEVCSDQIVDYNEFITIGSTNGVGVLSADGTAVISSRNVKVRNNYFFNCLRAWELWNHVLDFDQEWDNNEFTGNFVDGIIETGVFIIGTNNPNVKVDGNIFKGYRTNNTESTQYGVYIYTAKNMSIRNNLFEGVAYALNNNATVTTYGIQGLDFEFNTLSNITSTGVSLFMLAGSAAQNSRVNIRFNRMNHVSAYGIRCNVDNSDISFNRLIDTGVDGAYPAIDFCPAGFSMRPGTNTIISFNEIANSGGTDYTDTGIAIGSEAYGTMTFANRLGPNVDGIVDAGIRSGGLVGFPLNGNTETNALILRNELGTNALIAIKNPANATIATLETNAQWLGNTGTVSRPGYAFKAWPTTGIYGDPQFDGVRISSGGSVRAIFDSSGPSIGGPLRIGSVASSPVYFLSLASTNNVPHTNYVGFHHVAAASVLSFNANNAGEWIQTNRVTGVQTIVLSNGHDGFNFSGILLGEVSGGTSRAMTFVPNTGQLISSSEDLGTTLATSFAPTLTNGYAMMWESKIRRVNGTNIHHFSRKYFRH